MTGCEETVRPFGFPVAVVCSEEAGHEGPHLHFDEDAGAVLEWGRAVVEAFDAKRDYEEEEILYCLDDKVRAEMDEDPEYRQSVVFAIGEFLAATERHTEKNHPDVKDGSVCGDEVRRLLASVIVNTDFPEEDLPRVLELVREHRKLCVRDEA